MLCIGRLQSRPGRTILPGEKKGSREQEEQSDTKTGTEMCHDQGIPYC